MSVASGCWCQGHTHTTHSVTCLTAVVGTSKCYVYGSAGFVVLCEDCEPHALEDCRHAMWGT